MKHKKLPLGFTFSFPVRHEDIDKVSRVEERRRRGGWTDGRNSAQTAFSCGPRAQAQSGCNCGPALPICKALANRHKSADCYCVAKPLRRYAMVTPLQIKKPVKQVACNGAGGGNRP